MKTQQLRFPPEPMLRSCFGWWGRLAGVLGLAAYVAYQAAVFRLDFTSWDGRSSRAILPMSLFIYAASHLGEEMEHTLQRLCLLDVLSSSANTLAVLMDNLRQRKRRRGSIYGGVIGAVIGLSLAFGWGWIRLLSKRACSWPH